MLKKLAYYLIGVVFSFLVELEAGVVEYRLEIGEARVCVGGKEGVGIAINGKIPGPVIEAKIGDVLRIEVVNYLGEETSIHWHGVLVPNRMDGVPYITTPPIRPCESFVYEFPVKQTGTYWYHAHSGLQEQEGVYGGMVFYEEEEVGGYDEECVVVLSDWTAERAESVLRNLKKDADYYELKKDAVQSWWKVLCNGSEAIKIRLKNAFKRMRPMDISDIGYDAFLMNGEECVELSGGGGGRRVKLRIINAAASSYFILEYSGGEMMVVEADGRKVEPFMARRIKIAMAETYDVIVTVPDSKRYELRASSEDGTGFASGLIGVGELVSAATLPKPNLALMSHHGGMDMGGVSMDVMDMGESVDMAGMDMGEAMRHVGFLGDYKALRSLVVTEFPEDNPVRTVTLRLTGSMERYVWTINGRPMYASEGIVIEKGETVRFVLVNETMMNHPIHLHGHFFRVLNGEGAYSPLKHTVNVPAFETVEVEFEASEEKDWIFHCHNLYHMKLGMGGMIHYDCTSAFSKPVSMADLGVGTMLESSLATVSSGSVLRSAYKSAHINRLRKGAEEVDDDVGDDCGDHSVEHGNQWFSVSRIEGFSNFVTGGTRFMRNDDNVILDGRYNYKKDYEIETIYQRYVTEFLGIYIGGDFKREEGEKSNKGIIGVEYMLPLLIKMDLRVSTKGKVRFGLRSEHQLTDRVSFEWSWNTDKEYTLELNYAVTKQVSVSGNYDSRERFGGGIILKF